MKKLQHLFITSVLLVLVTSASFAGDMHSDAKAPAPAPTPTQLCTAPEAANSGDVEAEYLDIIVEALGTLLNAFSAF